MAKRDGPTPPWNKEKDEPLAKLKEESLQESRELSELLKVARDFERFDQFESILKRFGNSVGVHGMPEQFYLDMAELLEIAATKVDTPARALQLIEWSYTQKANTSYHGLGGVANEMEEEWKGLRTKAEEMTREEIRTANNTGHLIDLWKTWWMMGSRARCPEDIQVTLFARAIELAKEPEDFSRILDVWGAVQSRRVELPKSVRDLFPVALSNRVKGAIFPQKLE